MRTNSFLSVVALGFCAALMLLPSRAWAEPADEADLARVQGSWERKHGDDVAGLKRATKEIRGTHETITYYGEGDKVLHAHEVDFKLEQRAGIRIFTFFNWIATEGPDKGHPAPAAVSYIYRADENTFVEVWGFLPGQELRSPRLMMWIRKGPQVAAAGEDQLALQGTWAAASDPNAPASAVALGDAWTFNGDEFVMRKGQEVYMSGVVRLDPTSSPKAIDLIITHSPNGTKNGQSIHGIYEIKGSELRWCSGSPTHTRPHEFASREGSAQTFIVLRRVEAKP